MEHLIREIEQRESIDELFTEDIDILTEEDIELLKAFEEEDLEEEGQ